MKIQWLILILPLFFGWSRLSFSQPFYQYGFIRYKPDTIQQLETKQLIQFLQSDSIKGNAIAALNELTRRSGPLTIPSLEKALQSKDWQQRQMAAEILRSTESYNSTDLLEKVTVEGLKNDRLPGRGTGGCVFLFNAYSSVQYLMKHSPSGTKYLESALQSEDGQQRFLAAYILGATQRKNKISDIVNILIPHLKSDRIPGNACMASYALYHLGERVIPTLKPFLKSTDKQQKEAIQLILKNFDDPTTLQIQISREKIQDLTPLHHNPCVERADSMIIQWRN